MDNAKLLDGIKNVIMYWFHKIGRAQFVVDWGGSYVVGESFSYAGVLPASHTYLRFGAELLDVDDGVIVIWTDKPRNINININIGIYYDATTNEPIVYHKTASDHKLFSENEISILCIMIKEYLEKNKELIMPSKEVSKPVSMHHVYTDLDPKRIKHARELIVAAGDILGHLITTSGGN